MIVLVEAYPLGEEYEKFIFDELTSEGYYPVINFKDNFKLCKKVFVYTDYGITFQMGINIEKHISENKIIVYKKLNKNIKSYLDKKYIMDV